MKWIIFVFILLPSISMATPFTYKYVADRMPSPYILNQVTIRVDRSAYREKRKAALMKRLDIKERIERQEYQNARILYAHINPFLIYYMNGEIKTELNKSFFPTLFPRRG